MKMRFQKRIKIAPGVRLNISKSGVSTSLGGRGGTVNLSSKGIRTTIGIPGSGLSWSEQQGWAGAAGLKPADELLQLGTLLDKIARDFNALSPKTNSASAAWNKAVEAFKTGNGPSASKFQTLLKRYEATLAEYQSIEGEISDKQSAVSAIAQRLKAMSFGLFGGPLKKGRNELLVITKDHQNGAARLLEAVASVRKEVVSELGSARKLF